MKRPGFLSTIVGSYGFLMASFRNTRPFHLRSRHVQSGLGCQQGYLLIWRFSLDANASMEWGPHFLFARAKRLGWSCQSAGDKGFLDSSSATTFSTPGTCVAWSTQFFKRVISQISASLSNFSARIGRYSSSYKTPSTSKIASNRFLIEKKFLIILK